MSHTRMWCTNTHTHPSLIVTMHKWIEIRNCMRQRILLQFNEIHKWQKDTKFLAPKIRCVMFMFDFFSNQKINTFSVSHKLATQNTLLCIVVTPSIPIQVHNFYAEISYPHRIVAIKWISIHPVTFRISSYVILYFSFILTVSSSKRQKKKQNAHVIYTIYSVHIAHMHQAARKAAERKEKKSIVCKYLFTLLFPLFFFFVFFLLISIQFRPSVCHVNIHKVSCRLHASVLCLSVTNTHKRTRCERWRERIK